MKKTKSDKLFYCEHCRDVVSSHVIWGADKKDDMIEYYIEGYSCRECGELIDMSNEVMEENNG